MENVWPTGIGSGRHWQNIKTLLIESNLRCSPPGLQVPCDQNVENVVRVNKVIAMCPHDPKMQPGSVYTDARRNPAVDHPMGARLDNTDIMQINHCRARDQADLMRQFTRPCDHDGSWRLYDFPDYPRAELESWSVTTDTAIADKFARPVKDHMTRMLTIAAKGQRLNWEQGNSITVLRTCTWK